MKIPALIPNPGPTADSSHKPLGPAIGWSRSMYSSDRNNSFFVSEFNTTPSSLEPYIAASNMRVRLEQLRNRKETALDPSIYKQSCARERTRLAVEPAATRPVLHRENRRYTLLQLELYDNGYAFKKVELCRSIVVPINSIPVFPPLNGHPQPVFPFGILHPPL